MPPPADWQRAAAPDLQCAQVRWGQIIHPVKLLLPLRCQMMANQNQSQIRVGQKALFHNVRILLVQGAGSLVIILDTRWAMS